MKSPNVNKIICSLGRRSYWPVRVLTARFRGRPDFLIIGTQKGGTTSLHYYLEQHSKLVSACQKEVHYFDGGLDPSVDSYARGPLWYRAHFPLECAKGQGSLSFEATPAYLFNPDVPGRLHDYVPDAKLLVVLRDPVERAISHYFHEVRHGHEGMPAYDALRSEEDRLRSPADETELRYNTIHFTYKARGLYWKQLEAYYKFFDKSQIYVAKSDDLFGQPTEVLKSVYRFLGVEDESSAVNLRPRNTNPVKRSVDSTVYEYLAEFFAEPNERLYEMTGIDFTRRNDG